MSVAAQLLMQVEQDFQELRKNYNMFLGGTLKTEPGELRDQLKAKVKRLRSVSQLSATEQFRINNVISQVQTYLQLWERQVNEKLSGKNPVNRRRKATETISSKLRGCVTLSRPLEEQDRVRELYETYKKMNLQVGSSKIVSLEKFRSFLDIQTKKIQATKCVSRVQYEVSVRNEKVVIKSKSVKDA